MAILVDEARWPHRGRRWAHLVSDASYDELHAFAQRLGVPRRAFQGDHYDVPTEVRDLAVELGAETVTGRDLARRLRASGLRLSREQRVAHRAAHAEAYGDPPSIDPSPRGAPQPPSPS